MIVDCRPIAIRRSCLGDGLSVELPAMPEQLVHSRRELCGGREPCAASTPIVSSVISVPKVLGSNADLSRRTMARSSPAARVRSEHAVAQPQQPDTAQQVVQRHQRLQVVLDGGGPVERIPAWAMLLHAAHHCPREPAARGEFDPVANEIE